jgi:hypothetical protein
MCLGQSEDGGRKTHKTKAGKTIPIVAAQDKEFQIVPTWPDAVLDRPVTRMAHGGDRRSDGFYAATRLQVAFQGL